MKFGTTLVRVSVDHPRLVIGIMLLVTLCLALLAALPSLWPQAFAPLHPVEVDTDPENMLPHDEAVRVFHDQMKRELSLHDMVVLGIVNETHPEGVFNPESLRKIYELTEYAKGLRWPDKEDPTKWVGVIEIDLIAPSTVDNIEQGGLGVVRFEWLMPQPPVTDEEAIAVRQKAERLPFLNGTVISEDGKAICLYLPLTSKDLSYEVYSKLREKIAGFEGDERYFITGLPVAEDTFGVEMFKQMAISAPIAMVVILLLMLLFFRKWVLVLSAMIVAIVSVICTMALLIVTGNTIHIMSSMIPIFIMPIAVLDSIHVLSDFFDRYRETKDRRVTIVNVMETLFSPLLYTSLTTMAGFASLALTPIPPVQVFGLFIALGVLIAWFLTVTFIPAYVMLIKEKSFENFGLVSHEKETSAGGVLGWIGRITYQRAKHIIAGTVVLVVIALYGISRIEINDNPIRWFGPRHPIRVADTVLNEHFGGTYMAYLVLEPELAEDPFEGYVPALKSRIDARTNELQEDVSAVGQVFEALNAEVSRLAASISSKNDLLALLEVFTSQRAEEASDEEYDAWDEAILLIDEERLAAQIFKQPEALNYISRLQEHLLSTGIVGKSNSLPDIVKTVHRELLLGEAEQFKIPESPHAVGQCLTTFQNSHRPQDLWHFVTPDYRKTNLWVQLKSGDNRDMVDVVDAVDQFVAENPPPYGLKHHWFGLTYINVIWQQKMVSGMVQAFLGSFLVVFLMMTVLFRSAIWGMLSMVPLTVTIGLIYGVIGLVGKDYDMPVALLSSLSLGLSVDYAIHFLARSRKLFEAHGSWASTVGPVFGEPARAIARNVVVVGLAFLPLLAAPLVPYQTVGLFIAAILLTAGIATLVILPSLVTLLERWMFPQTDTLRFTCKCATCVISAIAAVALVAVNVHQFLSVGWTSLMWFSVTAIPILAGACFLVSRRELCKTEKEQD